MGRGVEERIAAVARKQWGVVTTAQLLDLGLSRGAVKRRARAGRLRRLHRGVYLVGPVTPRWAKEMAAVLACGDALLSHESAASLWGLTTRGAGPVVITAVRGHPRPRSGVRIHRTTCLDVNERAEVKGIPVTAPGRTLSTWPPWPAPGW